MSITDELRAWAHGPDEGDDWLDRIDEFCDRIDAAHERQTREKYQRGYSNGYDLGYASADDWLVEHEDAMEEHGWVRGPLDADGVPIRVGDRLTDGEHAFTVDEMIVYGDGSWSIRNEDGNAWDACDVTHYHAPTVEDVLREFAEKMNENLGMYTGEAIDADEWRDADAKTVAEYAAKLRLAEGVDE